MRYCTLKITLSYAIIFLINYSKIYIQNLFAVLFISVNEFNFSLFSIQISFLSSLLDLSTKFTESIFNRFISEEVLYVLY